MLLKRLIAISVVLAVLILIVGGVLWFQSLVPEQHEFALSNGSIVKFREATFGTNHTISTKGTWGKFVPKIFARWLKPTGMVNSFTTPSPSIVLWFEHLQIPTGGSGYSYRCSLVHEDGTESVCENNRYFATWSATNAIEGMASAYPRREKILHVRVYDQKNYDDLTLLGDFTVRNPNPSLAPRRTALPLPKTSSDGDLEVTLATVETGVRRGKWEKTNAFNQWTKARFVVLDRGAPSTDWKVEKMEATDSIGNRLVSNSWTGDSEKKFETFLCQPMLWPSETYKLRFEFSRKAEALFDTNEVWTIRSIAVPTNGSFTLVNTQWNTGKFTLLFHGFAAKDATPPWQQQMGGQPSLGFSVMPEPEGYRFTLVQVTDDRGKKIDLAGAGYSNTNWGFGLQFKSGSTRTIDVTVALHRSRFVEFSAQPAKWDGKFNR